MSFHTRSRPGIRNCALNQASDYFHDMYGGTMVHLFGLKPVFLCCGIEDKTFSTKEREEEGFTVHAGADEQSEILFLHPEFVRTPPLRQSECDMKK